jgi:hypothetical protein
VLTVAATAAFVIVERGVGEPILSLKLFVDRNLSAAIAVTFLVGVATFGTVTFLPQSSRTCRAPRRPTAAFSCCH